MESVRQREMAERPAAASARPQDAEMRSPERAEGGSRTWSFVQMNMQLLPIARPLPVNVAAHRLQEGAALVGCKPRTPSKRPRECARACGANISPRRQVGGLPPPVAVSTENGDGALSAPRSRAGSEDWHARPPRPVPPELRLRSWSDDVAAPLAPGQSAASPSSAAVRPWGLHGPRRRASVTLTIGGASKGQFKGKRILELQDEERRLLPDEAMSAPSPTKRSRRQL